MITETQSTTTNGETITGEFVFHFENIPISTFLQYRAKVREIIGFGNIGLIRACIEEKAPIAQNNLEKRPNEYREAQQPPMPQEFGGGMAIPTQHLPGQPESTRKIPYEPKYRYEKVKKPKTPKMQPAVREFLLTLVGLEQNDIITAYRRRFKQTKVPNQGIIDMFNRAHNIG